MCFGNFANKKSIAINISLSPANKTANYLLITINPILQLLKKIDYVACKLVEALKLMLRALLYIR